jgi:hypothetical protein
VDTELAVRIIQGEGFENAQAIVQASQQPYRPLLERLLAMIENESHGANEFGDEPGATPDGWLEQEVTASRATQYWEGVMRGLGRNGVGPTQITSYELQEGVVRHYGVEALANPLHTIEAGAAYLHGLIMAFGLGEGFRRYNGSGPDAIAYRDRALVYAGEWARRLEPVMRDA